MSPLDKPRCFWGKQLLICLNKKNKKNKKTASEGLSWDRATRPLPPKSFQLWRQFLITLPSKPTKMTNKLELSRSHMDTSPEGTFCCSDVNNQAVIYVSFQFVSFTGMILIMIICYVEPEVALTLFSTFLEEVRPCLTKYWKTYIYTYSFSLKFSFSVLAASRVSLGTCSCL